MLRSPAGFLRLILILVAASALAPAVASAAGWAPAPSDLLPAGPASIGPTGLVLSGAGALTAQWVTGLGAADLMVADRPAGGPWAAPERLSGGASVTGSSLAGNAAGAQAASWLEGGYVRVATRAPGTAWQPVAVPLSGAGIGNAPVLAVAPDGTVAVAWIEGGAVKVSVRGVNGAFSSPATVPSGTSPSSLAIAAGPASDLLLAWTDTSGAQTRLMTAYRPAAAAAFQAPVAAMGVTPNAGAAAYMSAPQVAFDPAGEASVIWLRTIVDSGSNTTVSDWEGKWRTAGSAGALQGLFPHVFESRTINSTLPTGLNPGTLTADASGRTSFVWPALAAGGGLDVATRTSGAGFGATQVGPAASTSHFVAAAAGGSLMVFIGKVPSVAFAAPGGGLGAFDATPFAASGTGWIGVAAGDAAGDGAALWATKDGTTFGLHATVYDATAPEARDVSVPATAVAGSAATFAATPWDALTTATATWDFGDGATATGASVQHTYATPGDRTVTLTVADQGGNAITVKRSVAVAPAPTAAAPTPPGAAAAPGPGRPSATPPAPVLTRVKLTPSTFAVGSGATALTGKARAAAAAARVAHGTVVSWRLSAAATVRLAIATAPARGKRSRVVGTLRRTAPSGAARLAFSGRVGRRALAPGAYRMTLTATDAGARTSKPVVLRFRVRRAAR